MRAGAAECSPLLCPPPREEAPSVFLALCSDPLVHASPPSSCLAGGRKTLGNSLLLASPFFLLPLCPVKPGRAPPASSRSPLRSVLCSRMLCDGTSFKIGLERSSPTL